MRQAIKNFKTSLVYSSCEDLPMNLFIESLAGKSRSLVKYKLLGFLFIGKAFLLNLFNSLYIDYLDLVEDAEKNTHISLVCKITEIETKKLLLSYCSDFSNNLHDPGVAIVYKTLKIPFDLKDPAKASKRALVLFKTEEFKLKELKARLAELQTRQEISTKKSNGSFSPVFTTFSRFQKYEIDPKKTTVATFVSISNQYKAQFEKAKANDSN